MPLANQILLPSQVAPRRKCDEKPRAKRFTGKASKRKRVVLGAVNAPEVGNGFIQWHLPIRTVSEMNARENHFARYRRFKEQRGIVAFAMRGSYRPQLPWVCTLARRGGKLMDDDNLRSAFKAIRDEIAEQAGVDDGGNQIKWEYGQEPGGKILGIRLRLESRQ